MGSTAPGPFGNGDDDVPLTNSDGTLGRGGQLLFGTIGVIPTILTAGVAAEAGTGIFMLNAANGVSAVDMLAQGAGGLEKSPLSSLAYKIGGHKGEAIYVGYDAIVNSVGAFTGGYDLLRAPDPRSAINAATLIGVGAGGTAAVNDAATLMSPSFK